MANVHVVHYANALMAALRCIVFVRKLLTVMIMDETFFLYVNLMFLLQKYILTGDMATYIYIYIASEKVIASIYLFFFPRNFVTLASLPVCMLTIRPYYVPPFFEELA